MPHLIHAFDQMAREGLIAHPQCCCEGCGRLKAMEKARQRRNQDKPIRGYVFVGEFGRGSATCRIPLHFGWTDGYKVDSQHVEAMAAGRIVMTCLDEHGVRYEWGGRPDAPIFVKAENDLEGIPEPGHQHLLLDTMNKEVFIVPAFSDAVFEPFEGNPVRLLNLAHLRERKLDAPPLRGPLWRPRVNDRVQLGFHVWDAVTLKESPELDGLARLIQVESLWVDISSCQDYSGRRLYVGELATDPLFIDPARLRVGSLVLFTPNQVFPVAS